MNNVRKNVLEIILLVIVEKFMLRNSTINEKTSEFWKIREILVNKSIFIHLWIEWINDKFVNDVSKLDIILIDVSAKKNFEKLKFVINNHERIEFLEFAIFDDFLSNVFNDIHIFDVMIQIVVHNCTQRDATQIIAFIFSWKRLLREFSQTRSLKNVSHLSISLEIFRKIIDFDDDSKKNKNENENDEKNVFDIELKCKFFWHDDFENLKKVRAIKRKKSKKFDELSIWKLNNESMNESSINLKKKIDIRNFQCFSRLTRENDQLWIVQFRVQCLKILLRNVLRTNDEWSWFYRWNWLKKIDWLKRFNWID